MEDTERPRLEWSSQFEVVDAAQLIPGDKIILPATALEQLLTAAPVADVPFSPRGRSPRVRTLNFDPLDPHTFAAERQVRSQLHSQQPQLPHPLTFRLVNPVNGRIVYAGIREFSADDGCALLSPFLLRALDIAHTSTTSNGDSTKAEEPSTHNSPVTVHFEELPKGTFVKLRPLEAGYDPDDWKSLLEEHMRKNYTTLTKGEILTISAGRDGQFEFLVDEFKPDGAAICVVDTDLEVDIEALNEDQARETLKQIAQKRLKMPGSDKGSSTGGELSLFKPQIGQVLEGEYVDYTLPSWSRSSALEITVDAGDYGGLIDLFVSPYGPRQRTRPREDEFIFADFEDSAVKCVRISPHDPDMEDAEVVYVSVRATLASSEASSVPLPFSLKASAVNLKDAEDEETSGPRPGPEESLCRHCKHVVPRQSLVLHEGFCLRNNLVCPSGCGRVFPKGSRSFENHWHCQYSDCESHGDSVASHEKHDRLSHALVPGCPSCPHPGPFYNVIHLAKHKVSTCPAKIILCRFCHLLVPQEGEGANPDAPMDPKQFMSGLTAHELVDGGRTANCHICNRPVRLLDMEVHLKNHALERLSRPAPVTCRNILCARTTHGVNKSGDTRAATRIGQGPGNPIGICSTCFGPLHSTTYDPDGRALKRRVERRMLQQLSGGCGKSWCRNPLCRTGKKNTGESDGAAVSIKDGIPLVKPFVDGLLEGHDDEWKCELYFCVEETMQRRRAIGEMLAKEGEGQPGLKQYRLPWCLGALEAENGDITKARGWLENFGVSVDEEIKRH